MMVSMKRLAWFRILHESRPRAVPQYAGRIKVWVLGGSSPPKLQKEECKAPKH